MKVTVFTLGSSGAMAEKGLENPFYPLGNSNFSRINILGNHW